MNAQFQTAKGKLYRFTISFESRQDMTVGPPLRATFSRRGACGSTFTYNLAYSHVVDDTAIYQVLEEKKS
jgi:hypothetical protein